MAEYIKRDDLYPAFCKASTPAFDKDGKATFLVDYVKVLESIPAADVREVVLCKDCEFYMQSNFVDGHMECVRFNHPTAPDDFCSHGVDMRSTNCTKPTTADEEREVLNVREWLENGADMRGADDEEV